MLFGTFETTLIVFSILSLSSFVFTIMIITHYMAILTMKKIPINMLVLKLWSLLLVSLIKNFLIMILIKKLMNEYVISRNMNLFSSLFIVDVLEFVFVTSLCVQLYRGDYQKFLNVNNLIKKIKRLFKL